MASSSAPGGQPTGHLKDLLVTLVLWGYFTVGFVLLFSPFYLGALFFPTDRIARFQRLNSRFYRGFFFLCRMLIPATRWHIGPEVRKIAGAIVLCNHLSYLDAIFLISLFPRHTTIAKDRLFAIPLFGKMMSLAGYIPSSGGGRYGMLLIDSLENIRRHLAEGGNVIVFPEGSRSRDGGVGPLHKGVFKIARYCRAPIVLLGIENTEKLFPPGRFRFNTCRPHTIVLKQLACLRPDYGGEQFSLPDLMADVRERLAAHAAKESFDGRTKPPR